MSKRIILKVEIGIEILNESDYNDFDSEEKARFLTQELLDTSTWPEEGLGCEVISINVIDEL